MRYSITEVSWEWENLIIVKCTSSGYNEVIIVSYDDSLLHEHKQQVSEEFVTVGFTEIDNQELKSEEQHYISKGIPNYTRFILLRMDNIRINFWYIPT